MVIESIPVCWAKLELTMGWINWALAVTALAGSAIVPNSGLEPRVSAIFRDGSLGFVSGSKWGFISLSSGLSSQCKVKEGKKIHCNSEVTRLTSRGQPMYWMCTWGYLKVGLLLPELTLSLSLSIQYQDSLAGFSRFFSTGLGYFRPLFPSLRWKL